MAARASAAFITDQVEEVKQRQFVDLVPGIVQVFFKVYKPHQIIDFL